MIENEYIKIESKEGFIIHDSVITALYSSGVVRAWSLGADLTSLQLVSRYIEQEEEVQHECICKTCERAFEYD